MSKPREYWIRATGFGVANLKVHLDNPGKEFGAVHVIEKQAYDDVLLEFGKCCDKLEQLEDAADKLAEVLELISKGPHIDNCILAEKTLKEYRGEK